MASISEHYSNKSRCMSFLLSKNAIFKKNKNGSVPNITHLLMDGYWGGCVLVKDEDHDEFLNAYAEDIFKGKNQYILEQRSTIFRLHIDNDFLVDEGKNIDSDQILLLVQIYQRDAMKFYGSMISHMTEEEKNELFAIVVLDTEPKVKKVVMPGPDGEDETKLLTKVGLHFVFPNLYVDSHAALTMRETNLISLESEFEDRPDMNTWKDIHDALIYTSNGLRMVYSKKCANCPSCSNDKLKRSKCSQCSGSGKEIIENRYSPRFYVDGSHRIDQTITDSISGYSQDSILRAIKMTSIRTKAGTKATPGFVTYTGAPTYDLESIDRRYYLKTKRKSHVTHGANNMILFNLQSNKNENTSGDYVNLSKTYKPKNTIPIPPDDPRCAILMEYIRNKLHTNWVNLQLKSLDMSLTGESYTLSVKGEGMKYCLNVNRDHTSASIWFLITPYGIRQKCLSKKKTLVGRIHGLCSSYKSKLFPIGRRIEQSLFPNTRKKDLSNYEFKQLLSQNQQERERSVINMVGIGSNSNFPTLQRPTSVKMGTLNLVPRKRKMVDGDNDGNMRKYGKAEE